MTNRLLYKITWVVLVYILFLGQYKLWWSDSGILNNRDLLKKIETQTVVNESKKDINQSLYAELIDLKEGHAVIEEIARRDLGLIKNNEHFYYIVE